MSIEPDIALYLPSLKGGGAERIMVTLANGFAERGLRVDLVLVEAKGTYLDVVSDRVNVVDLKASRVAKSIPALARYFRQQKPRAILSTMRHANVAAAIARRIAGSKAPLILREDNHVDRQSFSTLLGLIDLWLYRWAYRTAHAVIGISRGVSEAVREIIGSGREVTTIYNPVDVGYVTEMAAQPVDICVGDLPRPLIVAAGRLAEQKDYPTLLRAFAIVRKKLPSHLAILGDGDDRDPLAELSDNLGISQDLSMPGFIENPFSVMHRADLFVLSSRWEGFGNVLVEAMACGTPVVSTDCPSGPSEILAGGKWGRLVPVGDAEALAVAMLDALKSVTHPDGALRAKDFGVDLAVDAYLKLLTEPTPR